MKLYSRRRFMWSIKFLCFSLLFLSCSSNNANIKYAGFDDLWAGTYDIKLYNDNRFSLYLAAGGKEGSYTMSHDTIKLTYDEARGDWPAMIIMREKYFETAHDAGYRYAETKITRTQ